MDETIPHLKKGDPLPLEGEVFRIVLESQRDKKNKRIPAYRCFSLMEKDNNKLSVDFSSLTSAEECLARVGCSYKTDKNEYKSFDDRALYSLSIKFLHSLESIEDVIYDPINHDSLRKGIVNNPAHSLIAFKPGYHEIEPEVFVKLRDHAITRKVTVDMKQVAILVDKCRDDYFNKNVSLLAPD
jgi:hypothetical protein